MKKSSSVVVPEDDSFLFMPYIKFPTQFFCKYVWDRLNCSPGSMGNSLRPYFDYELNLVYRCCERFAPSKKVYGSARN